MSIIVWFNVYNDACNMWELFVFLAEVHRDLASHWASRMRQELEKNHCRLAWCRAFQKTSPPNGLSILITKIVVLRSVGDFKPLATEIPIVVESLLAVPLRLTDCRYCCKGVVMQGCMLRCISIVASSLVPSACGQPVGIIANTVHQSGALVVLPSMLQKCLPFACNLLCCVFSSPLLYIK